MGHTNMGRIVLNDFADLTKEVGIIEKPARMEGRNLVMFLAPKTE